MISSQFMSCSLIRWSPDMLPGWISFIGWLARKTLMIHLLPAGFESSYKSLIMSTLLSSSDSSKALMIRKRLRFRGWFRSELSTAFNTSYSQSEEPLTLQFAYWKCIKKDSSFWECCRVDIATCCCGFFPVLYLGGCKRTLQQWPHLLECWNCPWSIELMYFCRYGASLQ